MEIWNGIIRRLHKILERDSRPSERASSISKSDIKISAATQPKSKKPLEAIRFYPKPFRKMMEIFARALPDESIVWLTGTVRKNVGIVRKCWKPKLEFASQVDARTDAKWLLNFLENLQRKYPKHNLIIEAHRHPIGSELSSIDENALQGLTDWNPNFYWLMIACDIPLGCYEFDKTKLHKIKWEIIGDGKKADS